jgi:hypothetical protein
MVSNGSDRGGHAREFMKVRLCERMFMSSHGSNRGHEYAGSSTNVVTSWEFGGRVKVD